MFRINDPADMRVRASMYLLYAIILYYDVAGTPENNNYDNVITAVTPTCALKQNKEKTRGRYLYSRVRRILYYQRAARDDAIYRTAAAADA